MQLLITGANRGIGLGFIRHYLDQGHEVWACYRSNQDHLADLDSPMLHRVQWDISTDQVPVGSLPQKLDLLINNAGIYGPDKQSQSLEHMNPTAMLDTFNTDCVGPLRVVQRLLPALQAGGGTLANVSSKMGSIIDNSSGGTYAYRAAKAALLMVGKSMAIDLAPHHVHVLSLHPGWVQTDMTRHSGLIDVSTSVAGMSHVIALAREYPSGAFVAYDGQLIPY